MSASYDQARQAARQALESGNAPEAFQHLRAILDYPGQVPEDDWADALSLLADVSAPLVGEQVAGRARRAAQAPDNVHVLYDLGYELIERHAHGVAATVLARANELLPGQEAIVTELVHALESSQANGEACRILRQAPALIEQSFLCRYLLAFNSLMVGDLDEPRRLLPGLRGGRDETQRYLAGAVEGMLLRADAVRGVTALDRRDLRGWHFVLNGSILLHLSPHGLDGPMHGRYAYLQDQVSSCHEGLRRLAAVLDEWQARPARVYVLPEPYSAALAHAAGQVLGCPLAAWPASGTAEGGLVPVYDLAGLDEQTFLALREHRPGQVLWGHASCWTQDQPYAADLVTLLYQHNAPPWGEQMVIDPATHEVTRATAPPAPPAERGAQVVQAELPPDALADLPALLALARAAARLRGEHGPGALRGQGLRLRQRLGSPVPSSSFR
jgi:hypothetical protein